MGKRGHHLTRTRFGTIPRKSNSQSLALKTSSRKLRLLAYVRMEDDAVQESGRRQGQYISKGIKRALGNQKNGRQYSTTKIEVIPKIKCLKSKFHHIHSHSITNVKVAVGNTIWRPHGPIITGEGVQILVWELSVKNANDCHLWLAMLVELSHLTLLLYETPWTWPHKGVTSTSLTPFSITHPMPTD